MRCLCTLKNNKGEGGNKCGGYELFLQCNILIDLMAFNVSRFHQQFADLLPRQLLPCQDILELFPCDLMRGDE